MQNSSNFFYPLLNKWNYSWLWKYRCTQQRYWMDESTYVGKTQTFNWIWHSIAFYYVYKQLSSFSGHYYYCFIPRRGSVRLSDVLTEFTFSVMCVSCSTDLRWATSDECPCRPSPPWPNNLINKSSLVLGPFSYNQANRELMSREFQTLIQTMAECIIKLIQACSPLLLSSGQ